MQGSSSRASLSAVSTGPSRRRLNEHVQAILGTSLDTATEIVQAFDDVIARPLQANLAKKRGRELAKRNPMIYTARGTTMVDEWVDRALEDWETSAIEGHIGTWMEEVARIVSGGIKPGSGVDLQIERSGTPSVTELYAIQAAPNTKSAGGVARMSSRFVGPQVRYGRDDDCRAVRGSAPWTDEDSAPWGGSEHHEAGLGRLLEEGEWHPGLPSKTVASIDGSFVTARGPSIRRGRSIRAEATAIFGDERGHLKLDVLANPPPARPQA